MPSRYRRRLEETLRYFESKGLEEEASCIKQLLEQGKPPERTYLLSCKVNGWTARMHVYLLEDREIHVPPVGYALMERSKTWRRKSK